MSTANPAKPRQPLVATVREKPLTSARIITLIAIVVPPLALLSVTGLLWGVAVGPVDLITFAFMYVFCGLGITIGFHRLFSHRAFKTTRFMTAFWAIAGSMACQGPVTQWVTDHRKHHALSDKEGDPHSPHHGYEPGWKGVVKGLWHAQVGWLLTTKGLERGERYGKDLYADPLIRSIDRLYLLWLGLSLGIPALVGLAWSGGSVLMAFQCFVWAGLLRVFVFDHLTWSVNSICHMYGRRDYETDDESRNFWPLAIPVFGEAWHNNHHAFPGSARHGLHWKQVDLSWALIYGMERVGLVWDVKIPTDERQELRKARGQAITDAGG
ncbi:MAG: acyl-CoA desaturase [Actinobacteria bacterium]|nr:acyl-CoA desaturase [Actinomycetota bacterium]MBM3696906.1 acyl-CoA desaturase [Actinomycetota bacterium]